ncbi:spore coat U domain-containing protein [Sphingomonas parapaucimobilis]|uniref:Csu type fimbrial protein n=1 Tax=Sphingomonas parapaucimobilis TaxID=28213 RepID=UPI00391C5C5E
MKRNLFPARTLRRLVATTASGGMLGQSVLGAALSLPMLMIATPAQAATACSASSPNMMAVYQSGQTVESPVMRMFASCSGVSSSLSGRPLVICAANGTSSSAGQTGTSGQSGNWFLARSAAGNTIQFDFYVYYTDYSSSPFSLASGNAEAGNALLGGLSQPDANGNSTSSFAGRVNNSPSQDGWQLELRIPNQSSIAAGEYTTIVTMPLKFWARNAGDTWWGYNSCTPTLVTSFSVSIPVTIRVSNSCDITSTMPIDFGQFTQTNGVLDQKSLYFRIGTVCPKSVSYTLTLTDGNNATGSGAYRRRMINGGSYISYGLFTDSNFATPFPAGGVSLTGTGVASDLANYPYYAVVGPSQSTTGLATGQYNDTIIAMVNW